MTTTRLCLIATVCVFASTSAAAQPAATTLNSPTSDVNSTTIAFTWQSVATATWYQFWLGKPDTSLVMEQWYTADHADCAVGGSCTITVTPPVTAGAFIWYVRTWSSAGYGPWSAPLMFTVREAVQAWSGMLPSARRFTTVLNGQAVLDNETGLVWQRDTSGGPLRRWSAAQTECVATAIAGRKGWRLPSVAELSSVLEPTVINPSLPLGHPFVLPALGDRLFWSQTQVSLSNTYWLVNLDSGNAGSNGDDAAILRRVWCVRGGATALQ
jgi:hypothetical protein